jgi:aminoglycoside 6'-N-acetyltransferase
VDSGPIAFRPLRRDDFPLLTTWLAEPRVARWWNHETTPEAVERDFGPTIDGHDATEMFVAHLGERPFGFVQRYPVAAYAEYLAELTAITDVPPGALSIDYFIGEPDLRGRGLGAAMIAAFVDRSFTAHPDARDVLVPVSTANAGSWRALQRAGFRRVAEGELAPDNPRDGRDHYVYAIRRSG